MPRYGRKHHAMRQAALQQLIPGTTCRQVVGGVMCDEPMMPGQQLDLGHDDDGTYIGLVHMQCNRRAGQERSTAARVAAIPPRLCSQCSTEFKPPTRKVTRCESCLAGTPPPQPPAPPVGHHY